MGNRGNTTTAGTGSLDVTGGGFDTYIFAPDDGSMTNDDFQAPPGDILQISSALQPDLQESNTSTGIVLSFGSNAGKITLVGVDSLPSLTLHWTS